jgi:hypothetical protein
MLGGFPANLTSFCLGKKKANVHLTPLDSLEILVKSKIMRDAVSLKATKPDFSKT